MLNYKYLDIEPDQKNIYQSKKEYENTAIVKSLKNTEAAS